MEHKGLKIVTHASTWFAPVLVPLIIYFLTSDRSVKSLAIQALIFHVVIGALISVSIVFSWVIIGLPFLIAFGLIAFIAPILGIIRALEGRHFRYPIIGSWFE